MPVCKGCGGSYEESFRFCPYCGRAAPLPSVIKIDVTSDDWEYCEIQLFSVQKPTIFLDLFGDRKIFQAIMITKNGRVSVRDSEELINYPLSLSTLLNIKKNDFVGDSFYDGTYNKHNNLLKSLVTDGWQSIGRGKEWYNERFRRRLIKNSIEI